MSDLSSTSLVARLMREGSSSPRRVAARMLNRTAVSEVILRELHLERAPLALEVFGAECRKEHRSKVVVLDSTDGDLFVVALANGGEITGISLHSAFDDALSDFLQRSGCGAPKVGQRLREALAAI